MRNLLKILRVSAVVTAMLGASIFMASVPANASGDGIEIPKRQWSFSGLLGTYDKNQLQRGFQVYKEVCSACHSLDRVSYRNLTALGYSAEQVKAVASEYTVEDGPNLEGEMFDRPARPSDRFVSPYPNVQAARYVNNGALPLDLSLISKARPAGPDYIAALLTGFEEAPADIEMNAGMHYNKFFQGHQIAMAPPLSDGQITYADGVDATVEQMAQDVAAFLTWTAEPHMEARKRMGIKVMLFLAVLTFVMWRVKRKVWSDQH